MFSKDRVKTGELEDVTGVEQLIAAAKEKQTEWMIACGETHVALAVPLEFTLMRSEDIDDLVYALREAQKLTWPNEEEKPCDETGGSGSTPG